MKQMVFLFAIAGLIMTTKPVIAEDLKVVGTNYPPISTEELFEGIGYGLQLDLAKAIAEKAGFNLVVDFRPFKRMIVEFAQKKHTYILTSKNTLAAVGAKPEVLDHVSLGFIYNHYFYFKSHLGKEVVYNQPIDLKGYKVCVLRGSYVIPILQKLEIHVEDSNSDESCLRKLALKRNDIWGTSSLTANYYTRTLYPEMLKDLSHTAVTPTSKDEIVLAAFKGNPESTQVIEKLVAAYKELRNDGSIMMIFERYWGKEVPKQILPLDMQ